MTKLIQGFNYCSEAIVLKKHIEESFISLGEHLYKIKEEGLFSPQWSSWDEFLREMKLSLNTGNKLIQIYTTFVLEYGFSAEDLVSAGGWTVIAEVLPVVQGRDDAENWLMMCENLSREDLRKEVRESKTGVDMGSCKHKDTYVIKVCRTCGEREEVLE